VNKILLTTLEKGIIFIPRKKIFKPTDLAAPIRNAEPVLM